ncbi:MAG: hypothetical protein GF375_01245 [Candidatus Omnitrophica bacterium]|nr:hypothetical protein [Candidatus Omnitrophota bacterium]
MAILIGCIGLDSTAYSQDCYCFSDAIKEIEGMIKKVNEFEDIMIETINKKFIWECYYLRKGNMPEEVVKNSMIHPESWGIDFSHFRDSLKLEKFTHKNEILGKLVSSKRYLRRFSEFYEDHHPVAEMKYLRSGMKEWWEHVRTLHAALDEYFSNIAHFARVGYYEANVLYSEKCREIEEKYSGRDNDPALQTQYEKEMNELREWRRMKLEEADRIEASGFGIGMGSSWKKLKSCCEAEFFNDLKKEFFPRLVLLKLNDKYIKGKEKLSSLDAGHPQIEALRKSVSRTEKEVKVLIQAEKDKYGSKWKDRYRDPVTGHLPGGLLKDDKFTEFIISVRNLFPKKGMSKECEHCQGIDPYIGLCETLDSCEGLDALKM